MYGQETAGWGWDHEQQHRRAREGEVWSFNDIWTCYDFFENPDSVQALCYAYRMFEFGRTHNSPFWQAFSAVRNWPNVGVLASNLVRMAFAPAEDGRGLSIRYAPQELRDRLLSQQAWLVTRELEVLKPHVCLFFTGPNYDVFLKSIFTDCGFDAFCDVPTRGLARLTHGDLPRMSFRTYHPRWLRRNRLWHYIDDMRAQVIPPPGG